MGSQEWFMKKLGGGSAPSSTPPAYPQQPQQQVPQPHQAPPQQGPQAQTMSDALHDPNTRTQGGPAARTELERCPGCGSGNYFSRRNTGSQPQKHCYDCGYPLIQFGSEMGQGEQIRITGQGA